MTDERANRALFSFIPFHLKNAKIYKLRIIVIMLTKTLIQISTIRFLAVFTQLSNL